MTWVNVAHYTTFINFILCILFVELNERIDKLKWSFNLAKEKNNSSVEKAKWISQREMN